MRLIQQYQTLEGMPISDFHLGTLMASLPANFLLDVCFSLCGPTFHIAPFDYSRIPRNAIAYLFHQEIFLAVASVNVWCELMDDVNTPGAYLGFHGFSSYFGSFPFMRRGIKAFRYERKAPTRPFDQIIDFLKLHQGRFFLRTDSGGPYGMVRGSLVKLARETGRPLVAIRQFADKKISIYGHQVPLPGCEIKTCVGEAIPAEILSRRDNEDALLLLQESIDNLCP